MNPQAATSVVRSKLAGLGYRATIIDVKHASDLVEEIGERHRQGQLDEGFYRRFLSKFNANYAARLPQAQSLIMVAVPRPMVVLRFDRANRPVTLTIPPGYVGYMPTRQKVKTELCEILAPLDYYLAEAFVPAKLLAVRTGLARYGRNNLAYVEGMGSFHQLIAFFSDLPFYEDPWDEEQALTACETCRACQKACPSGAIEGERFLLHAERCITGFNKYPEALPTWFDPTWHNTVVGCMRCQAICPENQAMRSWIEQRGEFSEPETSALREAQTIEGLSPETVAKLRALELDVELEAVLRNLRILLSREN